MTNYREILRLSALGLSQQSIAQSCNASKRTVNTVLKAARRGNISWPLDNDQTNPALVAVLLPSIKTKSTLTSRRPRCCSVTINSHRTWILEDLQEELNAQRIDEGLSVILGAGGEGKI